MMRLKNREVGPPENVAGDNFRFVHPETGHKSFARDWWAWIAAIKAHRKGNNLPVIENIEAVAEDQLCRTIPPEWCERSEKDTNSVPTRLTIADIIEGTKAYVKLLFGTTNTVAPTEAERRATICANCYLNVQGQGCGACRQIAEMISGDVAKLKTSHDADLRVCAVCKCPLKGIVHFPMELLEQSDTPEKQELYPNFCWRQKESENYLAAA